MSKEKYHIGKGGKTGICKAKGKCPLGGESGTENHFESEKQAQEFVDNRNEQKHGLLPGAQSITTTTESESERRTEEFGANMANNFDNYDEGSDDAPEGTSDPDEEVNRYFEAVIRKQQGEDIDLDNYDTDWTEEVQNNQDSYHSEDGDYDGGLTETWTNESEEAFNEDIDKAEEVNEYYQSRKDFIDETVKQAESVDWMKHGNLQKTGEVDALKKVQEDLENGYDNRPSADERQTQYDNQMNDFATNAARLSSDEEPYEPETSDYNPESVTETYFDAVIDKHSGYDVDPSKLEHDWEGELEDNQDAYGNNDDAFDEDMSKAEECNEYFEEQKEFIDASVENVKNIDWTKHGVSQHEGEVQALTKLRDGGQW